MSSANWTTIFTALFLLLTNTTIAQETQTKVPDPLFDSQDLLEVKLTAPLTTLLRERPDVEELPGTLEYFDAGGELVKIDVQVRTRGRFRRDEENCRFPPLRLNFKKSQVKNTLFHKQDKLKLVTHCQNKTVYTQALQAEYTAYRLLNVVTDISFRARMLKVVYIDSEGKRKDDDRYAILIEHRDRLAARIGKEYLPVEKASIQSLSPAYDNLVSMFHYLIGNTDYSSVRGVKGEACCHNHVLFSDDSGAVWSVPYDFDQAGIVDAPHAGPAPQLPIRAVTQRLYRGRCAHMQNLDASIAMFQEKRDEIFAVLTEADGLSARKKKVMRKFVDDFYDTFKSPREIEREFVKGCI